MKKDCLTCVLDPTQILLQMAKTDVGTVVTSVARKDIFPRIAKINERYFVVIVARKE